MKKKGQAEIIGIAIVMVLVVFGLLFVIRFIVLPSGTDIKGVYERTQTGANLLSTITKTTSSCGVFTLTELLQDCATNPTEESAQYFCAADDVCTSGCRSCAYLNNSLSIILNETLTSQKLDHALYICHWDEDNAECNENRAIVTAFTSDTCDPQNNKSVSAESKQTSIPIGGDAYVIQFYLCQ